ncbi:MAG: DUF86 domain-containing protein [Candidatus Scalindua sp. AMX11]|nr:MAG: DUF86 domain-containing protein [Candidatus Scalindua sp.]NOG82490.1 DUF86 domain-containing protein [Planctomycetota bacterium]RZV93923.1 MAG: DUF86 domain-containing protein [Candidatus Scalindua sp. SCAELEC01]TDE65544.1 MAG: DUF86 domain-containing protein [Candidatus Scalindua sp. AMX11]GJQ58126.1 MAG: DUF86 domain-containing protein [Candidatus Scalindua sp.]
MTDLTVIENKISSVHKYLKILERYKQFSQKEIVDDLDRKGALERYLYLTMQATIDLSETVIAYKNLRKPSTMSESFHILHAEEIITSGLSEEMIKMTGCRNVIAHDYEKLNYEILYDVLQNRLVFIEAFVERIENLS